MSVSVIVPYHSGATYLNLCLGSLEGDCDAIAEIIIVSNGNCVAPVVSSNSKALIRVLHYEEALGYAVAIRRGAEKARSHFLLFCDADTFFPQPGWIGKHLDLHASRPNVGVTSSKLINYRTDRILDFGIGRTRLNQFHPCRDAPLSDPRVQKSRRVQMACSAVMLIERELFLRVGGFDQSLRYFYQDIDLCLRLKREKREVWVVADAVAYHRGGSSSVMRAPFQIDERAYCTVKNSALMEVDYPQYLGESLAPYVDHISSSGPFGLVNLSTAVDLTEVLEVLKPHTALNPLARWTPPARDVESITLPDVVETSVLRYKGPLLIFVDRYLSLRFNGLWRAARDTGADIVIDRHANVFLFDQVTEVRIKPCL
jgi:GT2 family glycosyltransferase